MEQSNLEIELNNSDNKSLLQKGNNWFNRNVVAPVTIAATAVSTVFSGGCISFQERIVGDVAVHQTLNKEKIEEPLYLKEGEQVYQRAQERLGVCVVPPNTPEDAQYPMIFSQIESKYKEMASADLTQETVPYSIADLQLLHRTLLRKKHEFNAKYNISALKDEEKLNIQKTKAGLDIENLQKGIESLLIYNYIREGGIINKSNDERYFNNLAAYIIAVAMGDEKLSSEIYKKVTIEMRNKDIIKKSNLHEIEYLYSTRTKDGIYERAVEKARHDKNTALAITGTVILIGAICAGSSAAGSGGSSGSSSGGGAGSGGTGGY